MARTNDPDDFAYRVRFAAAVIAAGRTPTRNFDNCFENYDGDEVAVALWRRAQKNPKIARNLYTYLGRESVEAAVDRLAGVRDLAAHAAQTRVRKRAEFEAFMRERDAS